MLLAGSPTQTSPPAQPAGCTPTRRGPPTRARRGEITPRHAGQEVAPPPPHPSESPRLPPPAQGKPSEGAVMHQIVLGPSGDIGFCAWTQSPTAVPDFELLADGVP